MLNIIASSLLTIAVLIGGFNTATMDSLKYLTTEYWFSDNLGAFTELTSSDKMSAFPTVYNTNLAKTIEVGTTTIPSITSLTGLVSAPSLATIGTITTGVWNGTAIPVNKGGTGTTSPSTYMVMLGNGANGLTMASTTGTTGQFLTSNGAGAYPSWQSSSVNETGDYDWTGKHSFADTVTITGETSIATTTTTNLIVLGGNISGLSTSTLYTATGNHTWTKPYGAKKVFVELWGAGASGGRGTDANTADAGGGGGGEYAYFVYDGSQIPSSATITIGAGGVGQASPNTAGNNGGNTSFGGIATSTGGFGGPAGVDGQAGGRGGSPTIGVNGLWGLGATASTGGYGIYSAAGGGCNSGNATVCNLGIGGNSRFGGAGGGGADDDSAGVGGTSIFGGAGGAGSSNGTGVTGSNPGGGGGASDAGTSGAGGNGQARVTVFF